MNTLNGFISSHLYQWMFDGTMAVVIFCGFLLFFYVTKNPLQKLMERHHIDQYLIDVTIHSLYKTVIIVIALITALAQLGINVIAAMTGFGIIGIAVGFAAKDTLGNVIAGFMILWDKPFLVGDWIDIEDQFGQVQAITLRTTRIHTRDNHHVVIPNQNVINNTVINHHNDRPIRKKTRVYVPYDSNIELAQQVVLDAAKQIDIVLTDPEPGTGVTKLENGLIEIVILVWAENARTGIGLDATVREVAIAALKKHKFTTPYPVTLSSVPKITKGKQ